MDAKFKTQKFKKCEVCNKDIHKSLFAKHLKSKVHAENEKIIPHQFFDELIQPRQQPRTVPTLRKLARAKVYLSEKEIGERMVNPHYFSRRYEHQYEVNFDRHHPNSLNSKITIKSKNNFPIDLFDQNIIFKEMAKIYGRLIKHFKFKHQVVFFTIFDKETPEETEQYICLQVTQNLTWSDVEMYDVERERDRCEDWKS